MLIYQKLKKTHSHMDLKYYIRRIKKLTFILYLKLEELKNPSYFLWQDTSSTTRDKIL